MKSGRRIKIQKFGDEQPEITGVAGIGFLGSSLRHCPDLGILVVMAQDYRDVDPRELRLPSSRRSGADPYKLQLQIARFGASSSGMPPPWVYEASDGVLVVYNGATRAARIAKMSPGATIRVEVIGRLRRAYADNPTIGDLLP
jgi:hypothetical protein